MRTEHNTNGTLTVSDIIDGYREHRLYIGYTQLEAQKLFKSEMRKVKP
jgi:hypothetical protein